MNIELIFYTQIASIVLFVISIFVLYRILVSQKDATIELLKHEIDLLDRKIKELESQSPDVLVNSLANRVEVAKAEIGRLQQDGEDYKGQISEKEAELSDLRDRLQDLNELLAENDLLCPNCRAPLLRRDWQTIYGNHNGRDVEAEIECVEYACGYSARQDCEEPMSLCGSLKYS